MSLLLLLIPGAAPEESDVTWRRIEAVGTTITRRESSGYASTRTEASGTSTHTIYEGAAS